jgi:phospholipase/carboxylesterase
LPTDLHHIFNRPLSGDERPGPAILAFHGWAGDEHEIPNWTRGLDDRFLVVGVRGPVKIKVGYGWFLRRHILRQDRSSFDDSLVLLDEFIGSILERYPIDPEKFFLAGFSQGGALASSLAQMNGDRFAGTILFSAPAPPVSLVDPALEKLSGHPIFMSHGVPDATVDVGQGREHRDSLVAAGADVTYHEYDIQHEVTPEVVTDLNRWLERTLPGH